MYNKGNFINSLVPDKELLELEGVQCFHLYNIYIEYLNEPDKELLELEGLRAPLEADRDGPMYSLLVDLLGTTLVADGVLVKLVVGLARPVFLTGAGRARPRASGALRPVDIASTCTTTGVVCNDTWGN